MCGSPSQAVLHLHTLPVQEALRSSQEERSDAAEVSRCRLQHLLMTELKKKRVHVKVVLEVSNVSEYIAQLI
jgi:hypothetical protein